MIETLSNARATVDRWSDQAIAYGIFRLSFGVNLCFRGIMRISHGTDVFAAGLVTQFEKAPLPPALITPFGMVLPYIETVIGALIILGLFTRPALIAGGLMMTALTFGTMLMENFNLAWLQLTYSIAFFLLLAAHAWNQLSVDALRK